MKEYSIPTLRILPLPAKMLATAIIFSMSAAMLGALAQIYVHDIVPTFSENSSKHEHGVGPMQGQMHSSDAEPAATGGPSRGDLFESEAPAPETTPFKGHIENEQFIWTLRWTHIHLFGMSMIFIFMGAIAMLLDLGPRIRAVLIIFPFVGIIIDIASQWLKTYISPHFFWLHVPGGGLFGLIFIFVSLRALHEMWFAVRD